MEEYKCNNTIWYNDVKIALEGDVVTIANGNLVNGVRGTYITNNSDFVNNLITNGALTYVIYGEPQKNDNVSHPTHYTSHPSGIECIEITRHYCFNIGNAIKYLWRAGLKTEEGKTSKDKEIEDLNKAIWYIKDRIKYLEDGHNSSM